MTKTIPLTKGLVSIVDDEDFEWASQWKWNSEVNGYARRLGNKVNGRRTRYILHREILKRYNVDIPRKYEVDHINHDKLDSRKSNLRVVSRSENIFNRIRSDNSSGHPGVHWESSSNRWKVQIRKDGRLAYSKRFVDLGDAIKDREIKEREIFGISVFGSENV